MRTIYRWILAMTGVISIIFSIGFFLQMSWATQIWPFASGRLSNIFISSILAAIGAPVVWIGLAGETRPMAGGALNLLVTNAGFAVSTLVFYGTDHRPVLIIFAAISIVMVVISLSLFIYGQRRSFTQTTPIPGLVRISFIAFAITLLVTAIALIAKRPNTFPWVLSGENSVMYGWIFLGAMCYFLYAIIFPVGNNIRGQLIGFLAYDIVLIAPFIAHFQDVPPEMLTSLVIYTAVVSYSGLLALYFLFIHPTTRFNFGLKSELRPTTG